MFESIALAVHHVDHYHIGYDMVQSLGINTIHFAVVYKDELLGNVQQAWNNFVQSGQFWALVIGLVVGYILRSLTAY